MFRPVDQPPQDRARSLLAMAAPVANPEPVAPQPKRARGGVLAVIGLTLAGAVAGGALAAVWPQTYVATSEMMVAPSVQVASASPAFSAEAANTLLDSRMRVLRSASVLADAAEKLNLAADNEFNGNDAGPFGLGGALANFTALVSDEGRPVKDDRRRRALDTLAKKVEVQRVGNSPVVAVSARSADPEKSALIANTVAELVLADLGGAASSSAATARLDALKAEVASAERALSTFRAQNGLLASAEEIDLLSEQLAAARARTVALNAQVASVRGPAVDMTVTGAVSPLLDDIRARFSAHRQRVESLSARLGPRHPELITAQAELAGAQRELDAETRRVSAALQGDLAGAVREEQDLAARLAQVKDQGEGGDDRLSMLRSLERAVETRRVALDEAAREVGNGSRSAPDGTRILSVAEAPGRGSAPSMPALSLAGAAAGLLAGLGFTGWRRDRRRDKPVAARREHEFDEWDDGEDGLPHPDDEPQEAQAMYPYPPQGQHAPANAYAQPEAWPGPYAPQAAPGWYPPAPPHDPWAQGYAPPAPVYAQPGYPQPYPYAPQPVPHGPVMYVPVPMHTAMPAPQPPFRPGSYDRDAYIDRRTDAALEEIRQSLRALREAIEDFADDRYGT